MFVVVTFKLPLPAWLVKPFVAPIAGQIFAQDAVMLKKQTEQVKRFGGERYTSTELDVLGMPRRDTCTQLPLFAGAAPPGWSVCTICRLAEAHTPIT